MQKVFKSPFYAQENKARYSAAASGPLSPLKRVDLSSLTLPHACVLVCLCQDALGALRPRPRLAAPPRFVLGSRGWPGTLWEAQAGKVPVVGE